VEGVARRGNMPRALITGGAGFIGSHLAEHLLNHGYTVWVIDNLSTGNENNIKAALGQPNFKFVWGCVKDMAVLHDLIQESDVIFHLAAAVGVRLIIDNPVETIETNVRGTENVLKIASQYKKRVVIASSSEVYGSQDGKKLKESDDRHYGTTTVYRWSYASAKALSEFQALAYHRQYHLPVTIVRLFNTSGPRQIGTYGMVLPNFVMQALQGKTITIYGDGEQTRSFIHVSDVITMLERILHHPQSVGEIFNIGNDQEITINQLAAKVKKLTGSRSELVHIPYEQAYAKDFEDMRHRCPNIAKIVDLIKYRPRKDLDAIIHSVIEYYSDKHAGTGWI
jgi:UDP-glucose 4-epimerase